MTNGAGSFWHLSLTKVVLESSYILPAAGLVFASPDNLGLLLPLGGLWVLLTYLLISKFAREGGSEATNAVGILRLTWPKVLVGLVIVLALTWLLCFWPVLPSEQGGSDWISLGAWPTVLLLLIYHPVLTSAFLLTISYTSAAALLALIPKKARHALPAEKMGAAVILLLNLVAVLLSISLYSSLSAQRL